MSSSATHSTKPNESLWARHKTDLLLGVIFILTTVLYGLFMFNDRVPPLGFLGLGGAWLLYILMTGWRRTPMDALMLGLLILLPLSFAISIEADLSRPKVHGVILGIALFYFVVNFMRSKQRLGFALFGLLFLAIGIAVMGLIGMDWMTDKVFNLPVIYNKMPQLITNVPRSSDGTIQKNLIGGALTFFLPLLVGLIWDLKAFDFKDWIKNARLAAAARIGFTITLILGMLLVTLTLVLTQSRGGYLGAVVGILALAVIKDRRFLWGLPLLAILLLTIIQRTAQGDIQTFMALIDTTRGGTLPGRMEIWQRALLLIQDFPFSGAGIGTFSPLSNRLYPYFRYINPQIPHPHNMILTMAVDLGIPGLMLYSALLTGFTLMIIKTAKKAKAAPRALLIGLGCGMLAHQLFGIMDAFMLGSKLGAVMWIFYGLAAGLYLVTIEPGQDGNQHKALERVKSWLFDLGTGLVYWLLLSLFALAFVNLNVILSLVLAILGGIALGIILLHRFEQYGN